MTFHPKGSLLDLTGAAKIRWVTKTSGFHLVRPVQQAPGDRAVERVVRVWDRGPEAEWPLAALVEEL